MNVLSTLLAQEDQGNPLGLLIIIVPFGLLIWLMVVPQRKQRKRQQELLSSLGVGDEVITVGGIIGTITVMEDQVVHLEVDHDVVVRVSKSSVSGNTAQPDPDAAPSRSRGGLLGGLLGGGGSSTDEGSDTGTADPGPSGMSGAGSGAAPKKRK